MLARTALLVLAPFAGSPGLWLPAARRSDIMSMAQMRDRVWQRRCLLVFMPVPHIVDMGQEQLDGIPLGPGVDMGGRQHRAQREFARRGLRCFLGAHAAVFQLPHAGREQRVEFRGAHPFASIPRIGVRILAVLLFDKSVRRLTGIVAGLVLGDFIDLAVFVDAAVISWIIPA